MPGTGTVGFVFNADVKEMARIGHSWRMECAWDCWRPRAGCSVKTPLSEQNKEI